MKILILSDIHFPFTVQSQLSDVIARERADRVVFLGDNIQNAEGEKEFLEFVKRTDQPGQQDDFIIGDNEVASLPELTSTPLAESVKLVTNREVITLMHGHQFNLLGSDDTTARFAAAMKKLNRRLPLIFYAIRARVRMRGKRAGYLVLGHCHGLDFFPRIKVICAGCLTTLDHLYNDRGYVSIEVTEASTELSLCSLDGESSYPKRVRKEVLR